MRLLERAKRLITADETKSTYNLAEYNNILETCQIKVDLALKSLE